MPSGHARIAELYIAHWALISSYKTNTLLRRHHRRMVLHKMSAMKDYENSLQSDPRRWRRCSRIILIGVTTFFSAPRILRRAGERRFSLSCSRGARSRSRCGYGRWDVLPAKKPIRWPWFLQSVRRLRQRGSNAAFCTDRQIVFASERRRTGVLSGEHRAHGIAVAPPALFYQGGLLSHLQGIRGFVFSRAQRLGDPPFSRIDLISCRNCDLHEPVLQQQSWRCCIMR